MITPDLSREFPITIFFSGVMFTTFAASGLFFFRFWKKTLERFFLYFSFACWMISFERIPIMIYSTDLEAHSWIYLFRLTAFLLILMAAYQANKRRVRET